MSRRELGDPDGTPEQPSSASGDRGTEAASGADRRQEETSAERVPATTVTREKYGNYVRGQGEPIPDHAQDGNRPSGWESSERDTGGDIAWDRAEPQHRETYADYVRAEYADPIPGDRPGAGQDADNTADAAADRDPAFPEGPPEVDIDRWHTMYHDYLRENPAGWDQGVNVAEDEPGHPPRDTSDLLPSGAELTTSESRESRAAAFRQEFYQSEVIDGIHDTIEQNAGNVAALFDRPPTGSHVEVSASVPQVETQHLEGLNASDVTMAGFVIGVMAFELGRWSHNKWESLRGT